MPKKNIVVIVADDMNTWATSRELYPGNVYTPNVDQLAAQGTSFTNAHVQIALCNPSRTSVWSGEAPAHTGVHTNPPLWFKFVAPEATLQAQLKQAGYVSVGAGKVFHTPSTPVISKLFDQYTDATDNNGAEGPWQGPVSQLGDYQNTSAIVNFINGYDTSSDKPFVVSLGLNRPHSPNIVPQSFFDLYPLQNIQLPAYIPGDLSDVPSSIKDNDTPYQTQMPGTQAWKATLQPYLAGTSFADAMVGRVVDALKSRGLMENTTVVFWSDNGIQAGQKDTFDKHVLWDASTRVPFIIVDPTMGHPGQQVPHAVELLDLMPTVLQLAGVPIPSTADGRSLVPLIADPSQNWDEAAVSSVFGSFSIRTDDWRYTRYFDGQEELYDHRAGPQDDPHEWVNQAGNTDFGAYKQSLSARLDTYMSNYSIRVAQPGAARLDGTPGNDTLINATSNTVLAGGNGNDVYIIATGTKPSIVESSDPLLGGVDTVVVSGAYTMPSFVENAYIRDVRTRSDLYANGRDNLLFGTINFADKLHGATGNDTMRGGEGADTMIGGSGNDVFVYDSIADSGVGAGNRDVIQGFDGVGPAAGDVIDLSALDANQGLAGDQAFVFIGTAPFTDAGQVRVYNEGNNTIIQINNNADLAPDMEIQVNDGAGVSAANWVAADFIL